MRLVLFVGLAVSMLFAVPRAASAYDFRPSPDGPITVAPPNDVVTGFATGDLDGNGNDDIIRIGNEKGIYVFLADNDGQGFTPAPGSPFGTGTSGTTRFSVAAGNFGGDSAIDLVVATGYPYSYETYLGAGDGTFPANPNFSVAAPFVGPDFATPVGDPAVGDVNDDSWPDLIVPMTSHQFTVLLGSSTGQFTVTPASPVKVPTPNNLPGESFVSAAIGDWNGDGDADVAFSSEEVMANQAPPSVFTAMGNGSGIFTSTGTPVYTQATFQNMTSLDTIDLHTNVYDDLAIASPNTSQVVTLIGSPTGLVPNPQPNGTLETGQNTWPVSVVTTKLSGDGVEDLGVALWADQSLTFAESRGDGNLDLALGSPFDLPPIGDDQFRPSLVESGDFNGDGFSDLAASSSNSNDPEIARGIVAMINSPDPVVAPESLDFPVTPVNQNSDPLTVELTNYGATDLYINGINKVGSDPGKFLVDSSDCPSVLTGWDECEIEVEFAPGGDYGTPEASLLISFVGGFDSIIVPLTGHTPARFSQDKSTIDFGEVVSGYEPGVEYGTVQYDSTGGDAVVFGNPVITGPDATDFSVENDAVCTAAPIPSGSFCTLQVKFAPPGNSGGFREAYLSFESTNMANPPAPVALEGYAREAAYAVNPSDFDFLDAKIGTGITRTPQTFTVESTGPGSVAYSGASIVGPNATDFRITQNNCNGTLEPGVGTCQIMVEFDPTSGDSGPRQATLEVDAFSSTSSEPFRTALAGYATADPVPPAKKPKFGLKLRSAGKVKPGKTLVVTATVKNAGQGVAKPLTLKASVPARLAKAPKAIRVASLAPQGVLARKLKVKVKKTAKRGKKLKVKVTVASGSVKKTMTRTIKIN